jgi:hypothetical protein
MNRLRKYGIYIIIYTEHVFKNGTVRRTKEEEKGG